MVVLPLTISSEFHLTTIHRNGIFLFVILHELSLSRRDLWRCCSKRNISQLKNYMFIKKEQSSVRTRNVSGDGFEGTTPRSHEGVLRPKGATAALSKRHGAQVVAGRSLPMLYVTSRIHVSARRSKCASVRMAPAKRKACSPRHFGGHPWSRTSWSSRLVRSLAVRAAERSFPSALPRWRGPLKRG